MMHSTFPPAMRTFAESLGKSIFSPLGKSMETLSLEYGEDYLNDFDVHLELLKRAFEGNPYPEWPVNGFIKLTRNILKEEKAFEESGSYSNSHQDLDEIENSVYHNKETMEQYYIVGLYLTYFLWPHHYQLLNFLREKFILPDDEIELFMEWGVGHGLLSLTALRHWKKARAYLFDLSEYSLQFSRNLIETAGAGDRCVWRKQNVLKISDAPQCSRIICSELLEHVPYPDQVLDSLYNSLKPGGMAFVTGAVNAPQADHIYLFTHPDEVLEMTRKSGFSVGEYICVTHPNRKSDATPPTVVGLLAHKE